MNALLIKLLTPLKPLFSWLTKIFLTVFFNNRTLKINLGSGFSFYFGWLPLDSLNFNFLQARDWQYLFSSKKIDFILCEHVLEHLSDDDISQLLTYVKQYSNPGLNFRVAVPDGFFPSDDYINAVKPGGTGKAAHDHRQLFNYNSLSSLLEKNGFSTGFLEYFDENGNFYSVYQNDSKGFVKRSFLNDIRNRNGKHNYTSIICDFKLK